VESWPLTGSGLEYDRQWAIMEVYLFLSILFTAEVCAIFSDYIVSFDFTAKGPHHGPNNYKDTKP
jgi:hypothetical protein